MNREFVIRDAEDARSMLAFVKNNAAPMAAQGRPMQVICTEHREKRSTAANRLMWVLLDQIAAQAWVRGQRFSDQTWHEHMKREHLPERTRKGVEKWATLPTGERVLNMGTPDLDTEEFATYIERLCAYAVMELGVQFDEHAAIGEPA